MTRLGAEIRFLQFDGSRVALAVSGTGPPLVAAAWWVSHLELDWADEAFRSFWGSVGAGHTLVRYDHPGTGMSDREVDASTLTLDDEVALLGAVVDELGLERVSLVGGSSGGCAAIAFAARFPERVDRLLLYGAYADGASIAPAAVREAVTSAVRSHWGLGSRVLADIFVGERRRRGAAAIHARSAGLRAGRDRGGPAGAHLSDGRARAARAGHSADGCRTSPRRSRDPIRLRAHLAASIPGARLVSLDGDAHLPWVGDWMSVSRALGSFLSGAPAETPAGDPAAAVLLSRREREVLALIAEGLSDREIAERIVVSHHTVHRHVANIRHKLGSGSRAAAVAEAARLGLL